MPEVITVEVPGSEVRPGDDYHFLSSTHRITRVEPYSHPVVTRGETWLTAYADTPQRCYKAAWGITVNPRQLTRVTRLAPVLSKGQRALLGFLLASGETLLCLREEENRAVADELYRMGLALGSLEHGYRATDAGLLMAREG